MTQKLTCPSEDMPRKVKPAGCLHTSHPTIACPGSAGVAGGPHSKPGIGAAVTMLPVRAMGGVRGAEAAGLGAHGAGLGAHGAGGADAARGMLGM
jgi:hypothetical protein